MTAKSETLPGVITDAMVILQDTPDDVLLLHVAIVASVLHGMLHVAIVASVLHGGCSVVLPTPDIARS